jgi:hypothetical protein
VKAVMETAAGHVPTLPSPHAHVARRAPHHAG